jgi:hypothetical protein
LAVEAGNAEAALRYAAAVEPRALASGNRRAALGIEKARALAMLGKEGDAITELRHAERLSPWPRRGVDRHVGRSGSRVHQPRPARLVQRARHA